MHVVFHHSGMVLVDNESPIISWFVKLLFFIQVLSTYYFMTLFLMVTKLATLADFSETINPIAFRVTRSRSNYWSSSQHCPRNILYSIKVLNITNQYVVLLSDWKVTCYRNWKSKCYILKYLRPAIGIENQNVIY